MRTIRTPLAALLIILAGLPASAEDKAVRNDAHGDPLPDGALARLGTIRFRDAQSSAASALAPDGKTIAVGGNGIRPVRLLDTTTGKELRQMKGTMNGSSFLAFAPDGKVLASSYYGNQITLWNAETGDVLRTIGTGQQRMPTFSFSGDGKRLVTGNDGFGQTNPLTIWDVATGKQVVQIEPIQNYNLRAILSNDGKTMASWGHFIQRTPVANREDETDRVRSIQIWDTATGKELRRVKLELNTFISNVLFAPDGKTLVTASGASSLIVWDAITGKELRRFAGRRGLGQTMLFSPDGKVLAATTNNGAVQLWDYATGRRLGVHELPIGPGMRIAFTTAGKLLAWQSTAQAIGIWDVRAEKPLTPVGGHESTVSAVAFSANGQTLFSMSMDGTICQWDTGTGKETVRKQLRDEEAMMRYGRGGRPQQSGAVSPDGKYVLTSDYNSVVLWELATAREVCSFSGGFNPFGLSAVFSPDGNRLALAGRDPRGQAAAVRILDVNTGQELKQLAVGAEELRGLVFSADGKSLAAVGQVQQGLGVQEIRLWDVADGKKRWQVSRPGYNTVQMLAFSPDGLSLAFCEAGTVTLLTAASGEELRRLTPKEGLNNVQRLAFAPDGRTLAVAGAQPDGRSGRIHIWEVSTGTLRQDLAGHEGLIASLAFAPDGSKLATGGWDTSVLVWDLVARDVEAKGRPAAKELDDLWAALDNVDGTAGFRAMGRLLAAPAEAVALFKKNLEPVKGQAADAVKLAQLIADLDHKRFNKREEASKQLELVGGAVEQELKKALADNPSVEKKKRLGELLDKLQTSGIKPELVRPLRAIEVLERLGTTEARQVLETLAGGAPEARLTREAKTALARVVKASKPTS